MFLRKDLGVPGTLMVQFVFSEPFHRIPPCQRLAGRVRHMNVAGHTVFPAPEEIHVVGLSIRIDR